MKIQEYYILMGEFLYGLGRADGTLQAREVAVLEDTISEFLKKYNAFDEHADVKNLLLTKISFYRAVEENKKPAETFRAFHTFLEANHGRIGSEHLSLGRILVDKLAQAFGGESEVEKQYLSKLHTYLVKGSLSSHE